MAMDSWHSYPSIYALGHRAIVDLLTAPVNIEEKIDGSQFSFLLDENGEMHFRSKGAKMYAAAPERMFVKGVEAILELRDSLTPGWTYRGEYLKKPKHNTLAYSRIPAHHTIIFDINTGNEIYLPYEAKLAECARVGLECVPLLFSGIPTMDLIRSLLTRESILGGQPIEGMVIKPASYAMFGVDKKVLMGKFVSESFKEVHAGAWREANPTRADVIEILSNMYRTPARWQKALIHLTEQGAITDSPRDIGLLIKEIPSDVEKEHREEIMQALWDFAWPQIRRKIVYGMPEWYKEHLMKKQFESEPTTSDEKDSSHDALGCGAINKPNAETTS